MWWCNRKHNISIHRLNLSKADLEGLDKAERKLILALGTALNELTVFAKLVILSGKEDHKNELEHQMRGAQMFIFLRAFIGKLHDAWELHQKLVGKNGIISKAFFPKLSASEKVSLERLKTHFGKKSPITTIRNSFSSHYYDEKDLLEISFWNVPDNEDFCWYISDALANSFFHGSEIVVTNAMIDAFGVGAGCISRLEVYEKLMNMVVEVSSDFQLYFSAMIKIAIQTRLSDVKIDKMIDVAAENADELSFPFYTIGFKAPVNHG